MSNKTQSVSVNFPFFGILTLIFITLKLTGYITWSWLWILAPMWTPIAFVIGFLLFGGIIAVIVDAINTTPRNRK